VMPDKLPLLRRKYSQNFLQNKTYALKIVEAIHVEKNDVVLEIGPGSGILTQFLYPLEKKLLLACEIDPHWITHLQEIYPENITFLNESILNISFKNLFDRYKTKIKVIGNIPYNITTPILFSLFDQSPYISSAVLMVQKEIADRLTASPKSKEYGILTVLLGSKTGIRRLLSVSRGNFIPRPKVDSTVIEIEFKEKIDGVLDEDLYRLIVRHTFNTRRKMLHNSLKKILNSDILDAITSVALTARPEELSIDAFKRLTNEIFQKAGKL
jgi:16S rRNA (adenine1518-N6/adenine1519-N6)-dimethyltransferase